MQPAYRAPARKSQSLFRVGLALAMGLTACSEKAGPQPLPHPLAGPVLAFSPIPKLSPSPTNRWADSEAAAALGHALFYDERLSANGSISCATCHPPEHGFSDTRALSDGVGPAQRHAPTLLHSAHQRWFGWGGIADSLWSQALGPLEHTSEMGGDRRAILELVSQDPNLNALHTRAFPSAAISIEDASPDEIDGDFARLGKALEAFQRKLEPGPSEFDRWAAAIQPGTPSPEHNFSPAAERGFEIFIGKGRCVICHSGPMFSDGEFHNTGAPPLAGGDPTDPGRYQDGRRLLESPFRASGPHSDESSGPNADRTRLLRIRSEQWGEFKTPTLRNVSLRGPFMHQGQFETLEAVIDFYDTLENSVGASHHQEQILQPIGLTPVEKQDLLAFLRSLEGTPVPSKWTRAPSAETR